MMMRPKEMKDKLFCEAYWVSDPGDEIESIKNTDLQDGEKVRIQDTQSDANLRDTK